MVINLNNPSKSAYVLIVTRPTREAGSVMLDKTYSSLQSLEVRLKLLSAKTPFTTLYKDFEKAATANSLTNGKQVLNFDYNGYIATVIIDS